MPGNYLGVDIGSLYTKFVVLGHDGSVLFRKAIKTLNRNKEEHLDTIQHVYSQLAIERTCATGYGRKYFARADLVKTEINCASVGLSELFPVKKTIIDIGGEDIKVIASDQDGRVLDFYLNAKCASGTGAFITEIAERAEIDLEKMSELASRSGFGKELNSYCTVFAKTEIMKWIFEEVPVEDLAKSIYISVVTRISTIKMDKSLPIFLIGGVAAHHPFLEKVMAEKFKVDVTVPEHPQMITAFGAAVIAKNFAAKTGETA